MIGLVVSTGLKKLLKYLEVVTGKEFVDEFVDAIFTLYNNKDKFLAALSFQKYLDNESNYQLFLVASTEQQKLDEILDIQQKSKHFSSEKTSVLINKSNKRRLDKVVTSSLSAQEMKIHSYFLELETKVSEFSKQYFGKFNVFEESMSSSPKQQVYDLLKEWEQMIKTKEQLDEFIISNWNQVNEYLDEEAKKYPVPFYNSVDIRESKSKYAPVDNNIYPAGFNNICMLDLDETSYQIKEYISQSSLPSGNWGIIIESHTKNLFYLDNLFFLRKAIMEAGVSNCHFISFDDQLFNGNDSLELETFSKFMIEVYPASIHPKIFTA